MRVLFVVNSLGFGGAERQTLSLVESLATDEFDCRLAVLKARPSEIPEVGRIDPGRLWRGEFRNGFDAPRVLALARFVRRFQPAVIVCANTYPLLVGFAARAAARSRARIVNVFHTTVLPHGKARRQFLLYRWLMNRIDKVVYVCHAQQRYWIERGLHRELAAVIHNGIDAGHYAYPLTEEARARLRASLGLNDGDVAVGICAGLRPEKAHGDLVRAIAELRQRGKPYKALIIGDGPCRPALEALVRDLGVDEAVQLLGKQDDVRPYLAASDVIALVSHAVETFSMAALEAMANARPLVLSDIGGAREQVEDGVNGFLFRKGDVGQLVDRLLRLEKAETRRTMGQAGRRLLQERFLRERMAEKYAALLREVGREADVPITADTKQIAP